MLKMWKYRHSVKNNPKSGYDWSATGQRQSAFCVSTRTLRMSKTLCSVRKTIQKRTDWIMRSHVKLAFADWLTVRKIIYRDLLLNSVSNNVAYSSCLKPIALPDWLTASSCCKRYSLTSRGLGMKSVYRRTTIQLAEWSGLCTSW